MSDWNKENPLDPIEGETPKSIIALHDYYTMGDARSLAKLARMYSEKLTNDPSAGVPTRHIFTLTRWSGDNQWQDRIKAQIAIDKAHEDAEFRQKQVDAKKERIAILQASKGILARHIQLQRTQILTLESSDIDFEDLARALKTLFTEERAEYDEIPEQPVNLTGVLNVTFKSNVDDDQL